MEKGKDDEPGRIVPANDNGVVGGDADRGEPDAGTWQRSDRAALTLARIIGRRMAREDFERLTAANDNNPAKATGDTEDGADTWSAVGNGKPMKPSEPATLVNGYAARSQQFSVARHETIFWFAVVRGLGVVAAGARRWLISAQLLRVFFICSKTTKRLFHFGMKYPSHGSMRANSSAARPSCCLTSPFKRASFARAIPLLAFMAATATADRLNTGREILTTPSSISWSLIE